MFLGRKKELDKLNQMWGRNKFEMAVIYGRRRVGKTTLIKEFCKGKRTIFFASSESHRTTMLSLLLSQRATAA